MRQYNGCFDGEIYIKRAMEALLFMTQDSPFAVTRYHQDNMQLLLWGGIVSRVQQHRTHRVGVSLKCQVHSPSVSFSFTMLDFVDGLSAIDFYSVFNHLHGNSYSPCFPLCRHCSFLLQPVTVVYGYMLDKLQTCPGRNQIAFTTWSIQTPAHSKAITSNFFQILVRIIFS